MNALNCLNPSAGGVPVPEDPRAIAAAEKAGRISYRLYPYFEWRFGDRGRRFTLSDSAWLAWLTRFKQERVEDEIAWLGSVLSNRGMPRALLESHLRILSRQLTRFAPEMSRDYEKLSIASSRLKESRFASIPQARFDLLTTGFCEAVGSPGDRLATGAGFLLVAAVADEIGGVKNAVRRVEKWFTDMPALRRNEDLRRALGPERSRRLDSERFERAWVRAVRSTIEKARRG